MELIALLSSPDAWIAFITLAAMEIVLGIDNVIFIAILVGRVPDPGRRDRLRRLGLGIALVLRIGLLLSISWIMGLKQPLFVVMARGFSGRDLILLAGGLFLLGKTAHEMHKKLEGAEDEGSAQGARVAPSALWLLAQIALVDLVFSLDSIITAVGMVDELVVMIAAMLVAVAVMIVFAKAIGDFVDRHPTIKMLALSFLILIGVMLVAEGFGQHIAKGYLYFAMAFALGVELLNMRLRKRTAPVHLHGPHPPPSPPPPSPSSSS